MSAKTKLAIIYILAFVLILMVIVFNFYDKKNNDNADKGLMVWGIDTYEQ